jgi:hypothetical protein
VLDGVFRGSLAVRGGVVTWNQLAGPRFVRVFPDVYVRAGRQLDLATRSAAAYLLIGDRGGALAGYSAALLLGADCGPRNAPAEVVVAGDQRAHPGLRVVRGRLEPEDTVEVRGCRLTSPLRTAWDLGRRLGPVEAVVAVDALARRRVRDGFAPVQLLDLRASRPGARGSRRLDRVVELADPRAESPMETRLRLILVLGGLPRPAVQHELLDEHGFVVARFDLAYPQARLAIEYDGGGHAGRVFSADDRWRDATTSGFGWQTLRFTRDDVVLTAPRTIQAVADALAHRPPSSVTPHWS